MGDTNTTTLDSLDASLNELLKAANATQTVDQLRKGDGLQIEGGVGDDFAGQGDAGSLDDMMIGKMTAAGFSPAQVQAMVGFMGDFLNHERPSPKAKMKGKASGQVPMPGMSGKFGEEGDEEEGEFEEEEPEEEEQQEAMGGKRRGLAKSFTQQFSEDEDISNAVDVSPFIEALTARTTDALDSMQKSLRKSASSQDKVNKAMAIALTQTASLVKSQQHIIGELGRRLGIVERTPVPGKAALTGAQAMHKSMAGEAGAGGVMLRKSELVSTLSYMNLEKGIREIGGEKTSDLIVKAEAGNIAPPHVLAAAQTFLRTHPMEAETAKRYA